MWRCALSKRAFTTLRPPQGAGDYEKQIFKTLAEKLKPTELDVRDVSGGCGSMFAIKVVSPDFEGKSVIKQHRLVNSILSSEISKWHGLQLRTSAPQGSN